MIMQPTLFNVRSLRMIVLFLTIPLSVSAQNVQFDRVLLPIDTGNILGAFGSRWVTELAVTNTSDTAALVPECDRPFFGEVPCPALPGRATRFLSDVPFCSNTSFLYVERGRVSDLSFTLRTRDVSRQSESWGTAIPVTPVDRLFNRAFALTDVPLDSLFRSTLRVYGVPDSNVPAVRLRFYEIDPSRSDFDVNNDPLLLEQTLTLNIQPSGDSPASCPAVAQLALSSVPELVGHQRIRIEFDPLVAAKYWAMASVTNNTTQEVTVITP
jgi:hypothetical protein